MNEIPATIEIRSNNDTEISYNTNENPDLDSTLNVTEHNNLSASINLRSTDSLESTINVVATGSAELSASLTPAPIGEAPLPATLDVAAVQENTTEIHYNSVEPPDLEATIKVMHASMIPASIDIPVTFTEMVEANKDTFINEDKPTSRYGDLDNLSVGQNYKTLIGFDFNLTDASIISSAKLILNEVNNIEQEIDIRRLLSDWREEDTTWANAPDSSFESYGRLTGQEVDITELVQKWHSGELENNGILLEGLNEVVKRYYSREYSNYSERPRLEIKYYDPNILAYNGAENIVSTVTVPYSNDLQGSIEIDPLTDPDLESSIEVKYPGDSEINSSIDVRTEGLDEINGTTLINKPIMPGELYVLEREDIISTIDIANDSESEIDANVSVSRDFITATVDLTIHNNLDSSVTVKATESNDLDSKVSVSRDTTPGEVVVPFHNDLDVTVSIRRTDESDINSSLATSRPDMPATITPNIHNNLDSLISVRQDDESDVNSEVDISRPDMPADIIVPFRDDINSTMVVRQSSQKDVDTKIAVTRPDMPGHLGIVIASSFPSTITVKRYDDENFDASISVARDGYDDLRARVIPRPRDISEIYSTMEIVYGDNLDATLEVLENDNLQATIEVWSDTAYGNNDITSKVHVRLKLPRKWNHDKDPKLPRLWFRNANRQVNDNA